MKCKHARHELALSIGRDLVESAEPKLQRHLATCPDCHEYRQELQNSLSVLQDCNDEAEHHSVWPAVERRLADLPEVPPVRPSYGLAPAFAVVAACLIMYVSMDASWVAGQSAPINAQPVNMPLLRPQPVVAPAVPRAESQLDFHWLQNDAKPASGRPPVMEYR